MNIEEIDKWLDNEYGCSYTRLEELHDFAVEQDLKHRDKAEKEIERLKKREQECIDHYLVQCKYASEMEDKYIIANNIINEFDKFLFGELQTYGGGGIAQEYYDKLQELKGSDK